MLNENVLRRHSTLATAKGCCLSITAVTLQLIISRSRCTPTPLKFRSRCSRKWEQLSPVCTTPVSSGFMSRLEKGRSGNNAGVNFRLARKLKHFTTMRPLYNKNHETGLFWFFYKPRKHFTNQKLILKYSLRPKT